MLKKTEYEILIPKGGVCQFTCSFRIAKQKLRNKTDFYILRDEPDCWKFSTKEGLIYQAQQLMNNLLQQAIQKAVSSCPDRLGHHRVPPPIFLDAMSPWPGDLVSDPCSITLDLQVRAVKSKPQYEWFLYMNGKENFVAQFSRISFECDHMVERVMHQTFNKYHI